jgi:hypothetical protein
MSSPAELFCRTRAMTINAPDNTEFDLSNNARQTVGMSNEIGYSRILP